MTSDPRPTRDLGFDWEALPTLTPTLEGTGGVIRAVLEDFRVDELPLYTFSGSGDFVYVKLEKRGHNTNHVVKALGEQLGVELRRIGVAGLKDRHAVTTQWISLPASAEGRLRDLQLEGVRILEVTRHSNKLGIGHLKGNRFEIRVREAAGTLERAQATLGVLQGRGLPNYFGPQRFGLDGRNAEAGLALMRNNLRGGGSIPLKRFLISAVQSQVFNATLGERLQRGLFDGLLEGDMAKKRDTGGVFRVEDPEQESPRAKSGEVSALGTLFGRKVKPLTGAAGELEHEVLSSFGLTPELFSSRMGDRRLTRVWLENTALEETEDGYWIRFELPRGSFATSVLRELTKTAVDVEDAEEDTSEEG